MVFYLQVLLLAGKQQGCTRTKERQIPQELIMAFNIKPLLEEYLGIAIKEVEIWENVFFIIPDKTSARNPRFVLKKNFIQAVFYPTI
jgi:hypothetical protein